MGRSLTNVDQSSARSFRTLFQTW